MKTWAIIEDTFRECLGKKILVGFFGLSTLLILALTFLFNVDIAGSQAAISFLFDKGAKDLELSKLQEVFLQLEGSFAVVLLTAGLFLSIFATADLVPSILQKGRIDLYLARPVSRPQFLLGKFLGSLTMVSVNIVYAIVGIWLVIGIKIGLWNPRFLFASLAIIVMFAVYYAIMLLVGVLTQSAAITVMVTYVIIVINPLLYKKDTFLLLTDNKILKFTVDLIYQISPRYSQMIGIINKLVQGKPVESWVPVLANLLIGLVVFSLTVQIFSRKDY